MTMNGRASSCVATSTVTCRSCMHSRRPDCVLGEARLISSTSTTFANTGPGRNSKRFSRWLKTFVPTTSAGSRSAVHWMRAYSASTERASARARAVFPTPGLSSISTCPSASSDTITVRSVSSGTLTARATLAAMREPSAATSDGSISGTVPIPIDLNRRRDSAFEARLRGDGGARGRDLERWAPRRRSDRHRHRVRRGDRHVRRAAAALGLGLRRLLCARQLARGGLGIRGPHQDLADEDGVDPYLLELLDLASVRDPGLRDDGLAGRNVDDQVVGALEVDAEVLEVAVVDPDQVGVQLERGLELLLVMDLHESVELERAGHAVEGSEVAGP